MEKSRNLSVNASYRLIAAVRSRVSDHRQIGVVQAQSTTGVECDPTYLRSVVNLQKEHVLLTCSKRRPIVRHGQHFRFIDINGCELRCMLLRLLDHVDDFELPET